jgi:hypothetical protein
VEVIPFARANEQVRRKGANTEDTKENAEGHVEKSLNTQGISELIWLRELSGMAVEFHMDIR